MISLYRSVSTSSLNEIVKNNEMANIHKLEHIESVSWLKKASNGYTYIQKRDKFPESHLYPHSQVAQCPIVV